MLIKCITFVENLLLTCNYKLNYYKDNEEMAY